MEVRNISMISKTHCHQAWADGPRRTGFRVLTPQKAFVKEVEVEDSNRKSTVNKIVSIFCMITCFCLCCWQLTMCIKRYLNFQVIPDVSIKHFQAIPYPTMTICNAGFTPKIVEDELKTLLKKVKSNSKQNLNTMSFKKSNITLATFWLTFGITRKDIDTKPWPCTAAVDPVSCNKTLTEGNLFKYEVFPSFFGSCIRTHPTQEFYYQVQNTDEWHVQIKVNPSLLESNKTLFVLVHKRDIPYKHEISVIAKTFSSGHFTTRLLVLGSKNFNSLNTLLNRCWDEETAVQLRKNCIEKKINELVKCKLPFFESTKHDCDNLEETMESFRLASQVFKDNNLGDCQNFRICNQTIYSITTTEEEDDSTEDVVKFYLNFLDNVRELISENFDYSLSSLLSDIAGNTGFFLGVSLVGMIESAKERFKQRQAELQKREQKNHRVFRRIN